MIFYYKLWEIFCKNLNRMGVHSVTAKSILKKNNKKNFLVLKHDVETAPQKALDIAKIENKYNHKSSFYVQAYLLNNKENIKILTDIQKLGHEVSYHHDVMDSNNGNFDEAFKEFNKNKLLFHKNDFLIETVCQHGNPVVKRNGYHSNRDFFRIALKENSLLNLCDIMVNYKDKIKRDYTYISDASYQFKIIYDPENNDVTKSDEKNVKINHFKPIYELLLNGQNLIVSIHPHRWCQSYYYASFKKYSFKIIRLTAKKIMKIEFIKKLMEKYYYLAKKI